VQANVLHVGGSQLPKKRDKRTNNDLQSITQKTFNSPFGITATTDGSYGKTNLELQPVVVSEIPNDKEELDNHL
jgi:hypothetical protein